MDALFLIFGNLFASGLGVMIMAAGAAAAVLVARWRLALIAVVLSLLAMSTLLVPLHQVPSAVIGAQWLVTLLCGAILWLAGSSVREDPLANTSGTWLLRLMALLFLAGVWWFIDPGFTLPLFTQVETDLLIWYALCGLMLMALTNSPLLTGIGILLIGAMTQALAAVVSSSPGLSLAAAVAEILAVLACGYLALAAPGNAAQEGETPAAHEAVRVAGGAHRPPARPTVRVHPLALLTRRMGLAAPAPTPTPRPASLPASKSPTTIIATETQLATTIAAAVPPTVSALTTVAGAAANKEAPSSKVDLVQERTVAAEVEALAEASVESPVESPVEPLPEAVAEPAPAQVFPSEEREQ